MLIDLLFRLDVKYGTYNSMSQKVTLTVFSYYFHNHKNFEAKMFTEIPSTLVHKCR